MLAPSPGSGEALGGQRSSLEIKAEEARIYAQPLQADGKQPGEIVASGIGLAPAAIDGLFGCVLSNKHGLTGFSVSTAGGVVTPESIADLILLIEAGIR